jgi:3-oxochol-4-en-24-oyl-CoA dehydrogenase
VQVPRENLVGPLNEGWTVANALLGFERLNHGSPKRAQYPLRRLELVARSLGLMDDAEFVSSYTRLRLDVADLAATYSRFADVFRSGKPLGPEASLLKIWATETYCRLVDLLIEVAGDSGGLRGELELGRVRADVLSPYYIGFVATIAAGSNEIQRNVLARRVLHLPS